MLNCVKKNSFNMKHLEKEVINWLQIEWKIWEEKIDYKIFFIDEKNGFRSIKSEIIINKPLKEIFDFVSNLENKKKYVKNYESGHIIKSINEKYCLQYNKYKGKIGTDPRDFTLIARKVFVKN